MAKKRKIPSRRVNVTSYKNKQTDTTPESAYISFIRTTAERCEPWFPWVLATLYLIFMAFVTFRYHTIGGFGVETDFYAELVVQTRKLLGGWFSPLNYGLKGPVYSLLLAGMYGIVRNYFYAGLILNLLSGFVFLITLYFLLKHVFNSPTAAIVMSAVAFNHSFQTFTYQAGTDLPFMALCVLSIYFLFRDRGYRSVALSAAFGLLAFLIRYNGVFIVAGSVLYLAAVGGTYRERLKRIAAWATVFICLGLPWFIPNWIVNGSPVYNGNHMNVALEYYAVDDSGELPDNWRENLPERFTGLGDIILYDPAHFFGHLGLNVARHFLSDMKLLIGLRFAVFVVGGFILFLMAKPDKRKLLYLSFGVVYFLILTLVFYSERFSLFLVSMYLPLAVWPLTRVFYAERPKRISWAPFVLVVLVTMSYTVSSSRATVSGITLSQPILDDLRGLGLALGEKEPDKSQKIIARKPHVAHYAGLYPLMFPENAGNVEELVSYCRENGIRYVLYSSIEYIERPNLKILFLQGVEFTGLEKVVRNNGGVVFLVAGM